MDISDDQLRKILNTLGADLNSDLLEECIKECLGEDFRNTETRHVNDDDDEEKTGGSDDERKTSDEDESSDDDDDEEREKLKKNLIEFARGLSEEIIKTSDTEKVEDNDKKYFKSLGGKISKIKGIGVLSDLRKYLKQYVKVINEEVDEKEVEYLEEIANTSKVLRDINELLTGEELGDYGEFLSKIFKTNMDQYLNKDSDFGKLLRKSTEKVRRIAKKKGIYIIGRKNRKFLGIKFLKSGSYSKKKNKKPNCKEYSYDQIRRMKKTKYKINWKKSKLPELIEKMNIKDVKRKFGDFQFGFELLSKRGCSNFGYTFPKGATRGYASTLLYSQI